MVYTGQTNVSQNTSLRSHKRIGLGRDIHAINNNWIAREYLHGFDSRFHKIDIGCIVIHKGNISKIH
jgi:hypothetical protein